MAVARSHGQGLGAARAPSLGAGAGGQVLLRRPCSRRLRTHTPVLAANLVESGVCVMQAPTTRWRCRRSMS